jgi:lipopolysaccharide export system permease protein
MLIDVLRHFVDLFVSKGVPFHVATEVLLLSLGHTFALTIPMAVLVGILMGIGQLAADGELTALKSSGLSMVTVLRPLLGAAFVITLTMIAYNHYVFPDSNHRLANRIHDINHKRPMMEIQERMFTEITKQITIYVKEKEAKAGIIKDVMIIEKEAPSDPTPTITTAKWGTIISHDKSDALMIELHDGEIHELPESDDFSRYEITQFIQHNLYIKDVKKDMADNKRTTRGDREMNLTTLLSRANRENMQKTKASEKALDLSIKLYERQWQLLDADNRGKMIKLPTNKSRKRLAHKSLIKSTRQESDIVARSIAQQNNISIKHNTSSSRFMVEFHKKFAIPVACMVFVLIGLPMAVSTARSGKGVSLSLAIGLFLFYYLFLVGGEKMADRGMMQPALSMWLANIVLIIIAIPALLKTTRETPLFHRPLITTRETISESKSDS